MLGRAGGGGPVVTVSPAARPVMERSPQLLVWLQPTAMSAMFTAAKSKMSETRAKTSPNDFITDLQISSVMEQGSLLHPEVLTDIFI